MFIDANIENGVSALTQIAAPSTGVTADVLPEVQKPVLAEKSQTGVSTRNGMEPECEKQSLYLNSQNHIILNQQALQKHWYALRTTYGREKKAYQYLLAKGCEVYYPTIVIDKLVEGRIKSVEVSRIPNIFFAYGTETEIKSFVYDNVHLPYLRFYYRYFNPAISDKSVANKSNVHSGLAKEPMIVPDRQMETLRIVCEAENQDTIITTEPIHKFEKGDLVRVTDGSFKGAVGIVARFKGQQRVGIVIDKVVTAVTAYVPSGMMQKL